MAHIFFDTVARVIGGDVVECGPDHRPLRLMEKRVWGRRTRGGQAERTKRRKTAKDRKGEIEDGKPSRHQKKVTDVQDHATLDATTDYHGIFCVSKGIIGLCCYCAIRIQYTDKK